MILGTMAGCGGRAPTAQRAKHGRVGRRPGRRRGSGAPRAGGRPDVHRTQGRGTVTGCSLTRQLAQEAGTQVPECQSGPPVRVQCVRFSRLARADIGKDARCRQLKEILRAALADGPIEGLPKRLARSTLRSLRNRGVGAVLPKMSNAGDARIARRPAADPGNATDRFERFESRARRGSCLRLRATARAV